MPNLGNFSADQWGARSAEFKVGIHSVPYLTDHGFQDMLVLPGSFYIEMALVVYDEVFKRTSKILRNVRFQSPLILSEEDIVIQISFREDVQQQAEFKFLQSGADENTTSRFASLEVEPAESTTKGKLISEFSIEKFKGRAASLSGEQFYRRLRENGNQYGPKFQNLSAIWQAGDQALARVSVPISQLPHEQHFLHPALIDSIIQLLAAFIIEKGKTFILKSIDRIEIHAVDFPEVLWAHATLQTATGDDTNGFVGDISVFDESGKRYLTFLGVAFALLDRVDPNGNESSHELTLCVASTFTAEPLEESLKFWGDRFEIATDIQFAPYNQIFQQLLDKNSNFHNNADGVNALLLSLEDWAEKNQPIVLRANREIMERCFADRLKYVLPNGLEIVHLNQYETDYVYEEIFRDQTYLRHGVHLNDGDTVIDIGANIGLFSLFVMSRCENPRIYAFEPSPVVYDLLKANCEAYGPEIRTFNCGVSDTAKTAKFTFYEKSSVFSGFHSDVSEDKEAISAVVRNVLTRNAPAGYNSLENSVTELTAERLRHQTYRSQLISVSDIIRENQIKKINLLKIDAEKSELEIINGIEDAHWPLIDQLVIEVHDHTRAAVDLIEGLLSAKGFQCAIEQEKLLENSGLFNIYATRLEKVNGPATSTQPAHKVDSRLERAIDEFCTAMNSFMAQSTASMLLCVCPRSPQAASSAKRNSPLDAAEQELLSRAGSIRNVHFIGSQSILEHYPLRNYRDAQTDQLGHIPYTQEGYTAIGTMLVRALSGLQSGPLKVIALDCDNTLWQGVCAEDGVLGIKITEGHRFLQKFLIAQMKAGMLICLCSKNNEKDVFRVFDERREMVLKREHFVSCRLNWSRKSDNLKALAEELNLGLESFLLLDDNPVECAEVRISCPEVLTLRLPEESERIPTFLNGIWAFRSARLTEEDQRRTQMYRENVQREQFGAGMISLKQFLSELELHIELATPAEDEISRVSQLTFRTNQFNLTTIRRSETELRDWLRKGGRECLVARVKDRFGDYGLVGVLLYETTPDQVTLDTFLLSCRVLGRGVEHQLLRDLSRKAQREGKRFVKLHYRPTESNSPAFDFINTLDAHFAPDGTGSFSFQLPVEVLVELQYDPDGKAETGSKNRAKPARQKPTAKLAQRFGRRSRSEVMQQIADDLSDIDRITTAVENYRYRDRSAGTSVETGLSEPLEAAVANIWKRVLGRRQVGLDENFFETGGTSLKAVQVIAMIQKQLKKSLSITTLFECPTIRLLAVKLRPVAECEADTLRAGQARQRGQQRRYKKATRETAG